MMNESSFDLASLLVPDTYLEDGRTSLRKREGLVKNLLAQRRLPEEAWDDDCIEMFIRTLAAMDTNNFLDNVGVGEREGRISNALVRRRCFGLSHGIGRSGDVTAVQPKAAGSSLLVKITNLLALDALRIAGLRPVKSAVVLPLATGMSIALTLLSLRQSRPLSSKFVVWSRMDQKACYKAIVMAGFEPVIVPLRLVGDELQTDVALVEERIKELGPENILCVLSTTSCFAPRAPDDIAGLAELCAQYNIGHVINNAYGVQVKKIMNVISNVASKKGRIDAIVQSTDKNFMVPVGGAIVADFGSGLVERVSSSYPGRASASPLLDLCITLLGWGASGFRRLLEQREELFEYYRSQLGGMVEKLGEHVLSTPHNMISLAFTVDSFGNSASALGSMMFHRECSGGRVIANDENKTIEGFEFRHFGAHYDFYPHKYMTVAAAIGGSKDEIDVFLARLQKATRRLRRSSSKEQTTENK